MRVSMCLANRLCSDQLQTPGSRRAGAMAMQLSFSQFSEGVQSQGGASCSQRLTCAFSSGCRLDTPHAPPHLDLSLTDSEGQDPLRDATNMFDAPSLSQMPSQLASQQFLRQAVDGGCGGPFDIRRWLGCLLVHELVSETAVQCTCCASLQHSGLCDAGGSAGTRPAAAVLPHASPDFAGPPQAPAPHLRCAGVR